MIFKQKSIQNQYPSKLGDKSLIERSIRGYYSIAKLLAQFSSSDISVCFSLLKPSLGQLFILLHTFTIEIANTDTTLSFRHPFICGSAEILESLIQVLLHTVSIVITSSKFQRSIDITLVGSIAVPEESLLRIFLSAQAFHRTKAEHILSIHITLWSRLAKPSHCLSLVFLDTVTVQVTTCQTEL